MPHSKKVSQTQLARELGISQALVSLVLNGRRQGINAETYDRIWAHAVKRGYHPKGMRLASSPVAQPRQVGIILRAPLRLNTPTMFFGHVQHGLHSVIEAHEFTTVFLGAEDQLNAEKLRRIFAAGHSFKGLVLVGEVTRGFLDQLRRFRLPIVAISARYPGLCHSILGNEPQALEWIVEHLHGLGHRRFGWLGGNIGLGRHESRLQALRNALRRFGLELAARYTIKLTAGERADGADAIRSLLPLARRRDFPTAFVTYNTLMAAGAVRELKREGWHVPADVSIASADFSPVAADSSPRITAAGSNPEKLGEAAARLVIEISNTDDEPFTDLMLPAQRFIGETSGPAHGTSEHTVPSQRSRG
ncbi:MAG: LacI family DNA-binding transcriptional regulator [Opitutaceae bacterium]|nr:LacI family DNA-binding transcriptional regulator [Opitutaceae bacterium]